MEVAATVAPHVDVSQLVVLPLHVVATTPATHAARSEHVVIVTDDAVLRATTVARRAVVASPLVAPSPLVVANPLVVASPVVVVILAARSVRAAVSDAARSRGCGPR